VSDPSPVADATRAVLLAVRLRAVAQPDAILSSLVAQGVVVDDVEHLLGRLELAGLIEHRDGRFPGWRLTADGRAEGERLLGVELDALGARSAVHGSYERFLALNGILLRVCTDWQLLDADPSSLVVNDHGDPEHDRGVIHRLRAVHEQVEPVCAGLGAQLPRFGGYQSRFAAALDAIAADADEGYAAGDLDGYHAIWFELHDHLLATLGIDRSTEPLPATGRR
jgi:hypothetical protein